MLVDQLKNINVTSKIICSAHFTPQSFEQHCINKRLKKNTIPFIFGEMHVRFLYIINAFNVTANIYSIKFICWHSYILYIWFQRTNDGSTKIADILQVIKTEDDDTIKVAKYVLDNFCICNLIFYSAEWRNIWNDVWFSAIFQKQVQVICGNNLKVNSNVCIYST